MSPLVLSHLSNFVFQNPSFTTPTSLHILDGFLHPHPQCSTHAHAPFTDCSEVATLGSLALLPGQDCWMHLLSVPQSH